VGAGTKRNDSWPGAIRPRRSSEVRQATATAGFHQVAAMSAKSCDFFVHIHRKNISITAMYKSIRTLPYVLVMVVKRIKKSVYAWLLVKWPVPTLSRSAGNRLSTRDGLFLMPTDNRILQAEVSFKPRWWHRHNGTTSWLQAKTSDILNCFAVEDYLRVEGAMAASEPWLVR